MSLWRMARPGRVFIGLADVIAGFGMAGYYFSYLHWGMVGDLLALLVVAGCLLTARHLWVGTFDPEEVRRICYRRYVEPRKRSNNLLFFSAAIFTLVGLLTAMSLGPASLGTASVLAVIMIIHATLGGRVELLAPLGRAIIRGGMVLLGMTAYPLLVFDGLTPQALLPAILLMLVTTGLYLTSLPGESIANRLLVLFGIIISLGVAAVFFLLLPSATEVTALLASAGGLAFLAGLPALVRPTGEFLALFRGQGVAAVVLLEGAVILAYSLGTPWTQRAVILAPLAMIFLAAFILAWSRNRSLGESG